jgi:hypothetical protein
MRCVVVLVFRNVKNEAALARVGRLRQRDREILTTREDKKKSVFT